MPHAMLKLMLALFVYFTATIMWLHVLKMMPLRIAYPVAELAFSSCPCGRIVCSVKQ